MHFRNHAPDCGLVVLGCGTDGGRHPHASRLSQGSRQPSLKNAARPKYVHPPPQPHRVFAARWGEPNSRAGQPRGRARDACAGHDGPRRDVRGDPFLQSVQGRRYQADHRLRGLRRPSLAAAARRARRPRPEPPDPPRRRPRRLSQPHEALHGRPDGGHVLQAPHRQGDPGRAQQGPDRPVRLPAG